MGKNEKETIMQGQKTQFRRLKRLENFRDESSPGSLEIFSFPWASLFQF